MLKRDTWCSLEQYIFASVIGSAAKVTLMNIYLPSGSTKESDSCKLACLEIRTASPLVLDSGFVACRTVLYT